MPGAQFYLFWRMLCKICFVRLPNFRKASSCRVKCPVPDCRAEPWSTAEVRLALCNDQTTLDLCVETLLQIGDADEETGEAGQHKVGKQHLQGMILEAATNTQCPNTRCHAQFSSSMDGCSAMLCPQCGIQFCWRCLSVTGSSEETHRHVQYLNAPRTLSRADCSFH